MEYLAHSAANIKAIVVFAKENKDTKARNKRLEERKDALARGDVEQDLEGLIESRKPFTWAGLNYSESPAPCEYLPSSPTELQPFLFPVASDSCSRRSTAMSSPARSLRSWERQVPARPHFWMSSPPGRLLA